MRGLHSYIDQISYGQLVILDPSVALCPAEFRRENVQRCKSVSVNLVQRDAKVRSSEPRLP